MATLTSTEPVASFPSRRQASCAGLRREYYPAYLRELIDYDYDARLQRLADGGDEAAREALVFLAAFSEEFYRGFRLKRETQVQSLTQLREAGAQKERRRRGQDVLAFGAHRDGREPEQSPQSSERAGGSTEADLVDALDERRAAGAGRR